MATGFQAWRAAKGLYVMPLLFAYTPLVTGSILEICHIGLASLFGIYGMNALIARHAEGPMRWWHWLVLAIAVMLCFVPLHLLANLIGAAMVLGVIWATQTQRMRATAN